MPIPKTLRPRTLTGQFALNPGGDEDDALSARALGACYPARIRPR
ncbi:hypothetical protein J2S55_005893 [Streptosporangium brasiliense]|uniref:Uncharacterized protein n=1 Tax=Streptosporangium brasiliense TaxID=47480 RepID=A0ABT9RBJ7_9ACTN|nr:hypothetical protein [Streptosporangium brasiliense]